MCLSKGIKITKAKTIVLALVLLPVLCCAQNKVSALRITQIFDNSPHGLFFYKGKIYSQIDGKKTASSNGYSAYNVIYNANLDTIATKIFDSNNGAYTDFSTSSIKSNFYKVSYFGLSFYYFASKLSPILFQPTTNLFPDTTGHKAYASKNFQNRILNLYQLKDSSFVGTTGIKTQIAPYPIKFGLWWLTKNMDTVRNVYYDFNLWQSGGCLLRNMYELPKKDLLLGGYTDSLDVADGLVMRVDSLGSIKFARSIGTDGFDVLNFIKVKNSYYMYGATDKYGGTPGVDFNRLLLIKIDSVGNVINAKLTKCDNGYFPRTVNALNFNDELLWYGTHIDSLNNNRCLALIMDTNGVVKKYHNAVYIPVSSGQTKRQEFTNAVLDSAKNVYLQNFYFNPAVSDYQSGLVKLDSNLVGCTATVDMSFTTTDITSLVHSVPVNYIVKHDSLIRVHGTITQTSGISGIVQSCVAYVGIEEHSIGNDVVQIYPNPSTGIFTIKSEEDIKQLEIYNTMGEVVFKQSFSSDTSPPGRLGGACTIDLREVSNGMYFIKITTATKILFNSKLNVVK
jgi:hypothetical protein